MKKLASIILFLGIIIFVCARSSMWNQPLYIEGITIIPENIEQAEGVRIADEINARNAKINSLICENLLMEAGQGGFVVKLRAKIYFEKPMSFRLICRNFWNKESDVGSNNEIFWFWSRRMDPPSLHWAKHEDLYKTRLKTPLNPMWMMESLGVKAINLKSVFYKTDSGYWACVENKLSPTNKPVTKITLLDPKNQTIIGQYLKDERGIVASSEIREFTKTQDHIIPKVVVMTWHTENVKVIWRLRDAEVNKHIDGSKFVMPDMKNKINMGE